MKYINPESKTFKVFTALQDGRTLTASQAKKMGVGNLSAEVSRIRQHGFAVYANEHKDTKGRVTTKYRLGKPRREVVAAGYRALAMQKV